MSDWTIIKGKDGKPSTNIRACAYDRERQRLRIEFVSGSQYVYYKVPWSVYMKFRKAKSKGSFFSRAIRDDFDYAQI